jgi:3D (Asp-Asp-Asp) domain-containing protein
MARVTFYYPHEDRFGATLCGGGKAKEGLTIAAPSAIRLGTAVQIPRIKGIVGAGKFVVQDRGRKLESEFRHGRLRLDVYVATLSKLRWCAAHIPEYLPISFDKQP